jgi:hypothetical protein
MQIIWLCNQVKRQITKSGVQEAFSGVQVLELVLVVDYTIYLRNGRNKHKVLKRVFDIVNVIKEVPFDLFFKFV